MSRKAQGHTTDLPLDHNQYIRRTLSDMAHHDLLRRARDAESLQCAYIPGDPMRGEYVIMATICADMGAGLANLMSGVPAEVNMTHALARWLRLQDENAKEIAATGRSEMEIGDRRVGRSKLTRAAQMRVLLREIAHVAQIPGDAVFMD